MLKGRSAGWMGIVLILALAAGLRLYRFSEVPPGNWYDEAINGLDALRILREPGWPLFFDTEGHPREPLYMYCVAASIGLFGANHVALRAPSVAIGLLTIFAIWLLAREWFKGDDAANPPNPDANGRAVWAPWGADWRPWGAALVLALMRWQIHFNRLSFRTNLTPLFLCLLLWAAWRLARERRGQWAAACGFILGLGFATYLAFRIAPALLAVVGIHALWRRGRDAAGAAFSRPARRIPALALLFALGLFAGGAPTIVDAIAHPEHLTGRAAEVNPFAKGLGAGLRGVAGQAADIALMFFVRGDHVAKHNIPGSPAWAQIYWLGAPGEKEVEAWDDADRAAVLLGQPRPDRHGCGLPVFDFATSLVFALGLGLIAARARRETYAFALLAWMILMAAASVFSFGAPNYLRMLGMTPALAIILVEGAEWIRARLARRLGARAGAVFLAVFFLHFGVIEAKRYFHDWPAHPLTWTEFNTEFAELGRFIRRQPGDVAFLVPDFIRNHPTFVFETFDRPGVFGYDGEPAATVEPWKRIQARGLEKSGKEKETWRRYEAIAPLPPYPPAPLDAEQLHSLTPRVILRTPAGRPWAAVVPLAEPPTPPKPASAAGSPASLPGPLNKTSSHANP